MALTCKKCKRSNPSGARYCHHDGMPLDDHDIGVVSASEQRFLSPFVFPSGRACCTFTELVNACLDEWPTARALLGQGALKTFLERMGRNDLAETARKGATFPDPDLGLDEFLTTLPGPELPPARLVVEPLKVDLGWIKPGQDTTFSVRLVNRGRRLLFGSITCPDGLWLLVAGPQGGSEKRFKFTQQTTLEIFVRGGQLRAGPKPLDAHLLIDSNGGSGTIKVVVEVPIKQFPTGALAGARSPRQIAEKAKAYPKEAAALFESGAVIAWYRDNGWDYPVQGPTSSGLAAVQQFFEALGLSRPPKLGARPTSVELTGTPGAVLRTTVHVDTDENKPIYVQGHANQPWLRVDGVSLAGRKATVRVVVEVPDVAGERQTGVLTLIGNGNQRIQIPVTVTAGRP